MEINKCIVCGEEATTIKFGHGELTLCSKEKCTKILNLRINTSIIECKDIKQSLCKKCAGLKTLHIYEKKIPAIDWVKYGMSDIGCIC